MPRYQLGQAAGPRRCGQGDLGSCADGELSEEKAASLIADATGGRAFFPFQIRDVANAFAEIQDELRSQYAIAYKPADLKSDGHYRTIEIVANDRKNFRVRARRGWYAPAR